MGIQWNDLRAQLSGCPCGHNHDFTPPRMTMRPGLLTQAGLLLREEGLGGRLHIVADNNTWRAAHALEPSLLAAGFVLSHTFYEDKQTADMADVERVQHEAGGADALVSVGTGSLNDICRLAAYRLDTPLVIVATAPSMDGFASPMAPLVENGFKRTVTACAPRIILADSDVLADAPIRLKAAGLGDLLGKYTALFDWRVAHQVTGEYYCPRIADLMHKAVDRAVALIQSVPKTRREHIAYAEALMEALVLSGIAMLASGCTRPASGAEHHMAHFWEMQYALRGWLPLFHGEKVGVACALLCDLYHSLAQIQAPVIRRQAMDCGFLQSVYGPLWPEVLAENTPDLLDAADADAFLAAWPAIQADIRALPSGQDIARLLRMAGGHPDPASAGLPYELVTQAKQAACYIRFRVTLLRMATAWLSQDS